MTERVGGLYGNVSILEAAGSGMNRGGAMFRRYEFHSKLSQEEIYSRLALHCKPAKWEIGRAHV